MRRQKTKWQGSSACTAMIMLSSTVRLRKRLVIWKVRASPKAARRYSLRLPTSSPNSQISPLVAGIWPLMTLKSVVFPAPLVPITARRSPG